MTDLPPGSTGKEMADSLHNSIPPLSKGEPVTEELTAENAVQAATDFLNGLQPYPATFSGRGIAICAGGRRYNTCAWVLVRLLRSLKCELPIEVWC